MCGAVLCLVTPPCPALCDPMDCVGHQAPLSKGFSRQEYCGFPCPPPGDLPNPGIESRSSALWADTLLSEPPGKPSHRLYSLSCLYKFLYGMLAFFFSNTNSGRNVSHALW